MLGVNDGYSEELDEGPNDGIVLDCDDKPDECCLVGSIEGVSDDSIVVMSKLVALFLSIISMNIVLGYGICSIFEGLWDDVR